MLMPHQLTPQSLSKIIYPYRWDVDLISDHLDIPTDTIFEF